MIWFLVLALVPAVVTALKARWGLLAVGSLSLLSLVGITPGFLFVAVVNWYAGMVRLAKPDSVWARRFYSSHQVALARARFAQREAPAYARERPVLDRLFNVEREPRQTVPGVIVDPQIARELNIRSARSKRVLGWSLVALSPIVFFVALLGTTNLDPESQVVVTVIVVPGAVLVTGLVLAVRARSALRRLG
jgi:hypothetical protein